MKHSTSKNKRGLKREDPIWLKGPSHRVEKVSNTMKMIAANYVMREANHPDLGPEVSIHDVEVTKDLRSAKIFYSVMNFHEPSLDPDEETIKKVGNALKDIRPEVSKHIVNEMGLKFIPRIIFVYRTPYSDNIEKILHSLKKT